MQDDDTNALIGQMFALLTARFEDGAGIAIEGQVPDPATIAALIDQVRTTASDAIALVNAIRVIHAIRT